MDTITAIQARRSIRRFKPDPVPRELTQAVLQAGMNAPSAKNRQPWRFYVVSGAAKEQMAEAMRTDLQWQEDSGMDSEEDRALLKGAWYTLGIMEKAPVTIFIFNPFGKPPTEGLAPYGERFFELANAQSVGAAIQNMCLAACEQDLGSLWICDVFSAFHSLGKWLQTDAQLVAALSLGYPDETPPARPRVPVGEITTYLE